ncbi:hypothetical protein GGS26DRAFT_548336 [Hypomontagnella submonticulosa]|nr:hypothetical protein GGS26DRAFT_548336 [Hypomontagnella submonticulosa]
MAAKKESFIAKEWSEPSLPEWSEIEKTYWENTKRVREMEDEEHRQNYASNEAKLRSRIVDLYDEKARLERELQHNDMEIQHYEKEQERLVHEFEETQGRVLIQRREEDQLQRQQFARQRQELESKENTRPKSSSSARRQSNREVLSQTNGTGNAAGWTSINGSRRRTRRDEEEPPADPGNLLSSIYHNPVDSESLNARTMPLRSSANRSRASLASSNGATNEADVPDGYQANRPKDRPLKPKQRHSLPSIPAAGRSPNGKLPGSEASNEARAKSPSGASVASGRKSLPSAKGSVPPAETSTPAAPEGYDITRETLLIKYDSKTVTAPPMFAGIPLERIDEGHPYWDPEWQPLEAIIQPQLTTWKDKLETLKQDPNAVRHTVFLANRQVNRGQSVIDFLAEEKWHPYQFVGKEMLNKFYKTYINYDTMFRLVNVHEELKKFEIEVTPLEWIRQRMYDLAEAQGDKFNLSKIIHDLYHDANLKYLREKHGYGNIGRPSGYKLREKDPEKAAAKKTKQEMGSMRRKARRSIGQVDPEDAPSVEDMQKGQEQSRGEFLEPVTPRLQKRQRLEPAPAQEEPEEDDLEYSGWTSTDSFSAGRIMHLDWRVYVIKTPALTTSPDITQYWTWKQDKELFEHHVLRDVHPKVTWGYYRNASDFALALKEIQEILYAPDSQKIDVATNDESRPHVLAYFKRERTKKRFLAFAKKKGIKLVKSTRAILEDSWDSMESKTMSNEDEDI